MSRLMNHKFSNMLMCVYDSKKTDVPIMIQCLFVSYIGIIDDSMFWIIIILILRSFDSHGFDDFNKGSEYQKDPTKMLYLKAQ